MYATGPGQTSVTVTMPTATSAFYLYFEPASGSSYTVTVSGLAGDGATNVSTSASVNGSFGVLYFGIYSSNNATVASVTIGCHVGCNGFAIGEFGISVAVASIALSPGNTSATVGTGVTETTTVKDAYGHPVADRAAVKLSVSGITTATGSSPATNAQASFTYGAILPGTDTLTAAGGTNPSDTATITWTPPLSTHDAILWIENFRGPSCTARPQLSGAVVRPAR